MRFLFGFGVLILVLVVLGVRDVVVFKGLVFYRENEI